MVDIVTSRMLYLLVHSSIHSLQLYRGIIQQRRNPLRRIDIGRIGTPAVNQLSRTCKQTVQNMIGQEHIQRVVTAGQGFFIPILLFVRPSFRIVRIHFIQTENIGSRIIFIFLNG